MNIVQQDKLSCPSGDGTPVMGAADAEAALVAALEAFVSTDEHGRVIAWNPKAEDIFGWEAGQACGEILQELIIAPRHREAYADVVASLTSQDAEHAQGERLELEGLRPHGHEFPLELSITTSRSPTGYSLQLFARDITARKRAERFARVRAAVSGVLAEAESTEQAGRCVVEAVAANLRWPVVELWIADVSHHVLRCAARHTDIDRDAKTSLLDELATGVGVPGVACETGQPVWVPDLSTDARYLPPGIAGPADLHVAVAVPFRAGAMSTTTGDGITGVLVCYGNHAEDPEDVLLALLDGIAAHLGQYLQRRRGEELAIDLARSKDDMLALTTHELRNPLAIITTCVEELDVEPDELSVQQRRQYLRTVRRNTDRLTTLINDLLDLALLESEPFAIRLQTTELCEVINEAVTDIRPAANAKSLTISVDLPDHLLLEGDGQRLRQVADNLLSNAVKYTPAGGSITVIAEATADRIDWSIADTGIGIPASERPNIFQRFYRASTARSAAIPGTGLGLVLTRTIIERHHGSIEITDCDRPGTCFQIHLPATTPDRCTARDANLNPA